MAQYCISNHSTDVINELLLSIEHVDLIRVYPDGAVDHTDTMPLFDIRMPPFLDTRAHYPSAFLETTRARRVKAAARRQAEDERARRSREGIEHSNNTAGSSNIDNEEDDDDEGVGDVEEDEDDDHVNHGYDSVAFISRYASTADGGPDAGFFAIMHLLEASERLHLPRNSSVKSHLSIEITKSIIQLITDVNTYRACMDISCIFRKLCQRERYLDE